MSFAIFKNTFKRSWKLLAIFFCLLCFYQSVIISLIDPDDMQKIKELFGTMGDFMGVFSISIASMTSPLAYTASVFFSLIIMAFTMVFYVIQANSLIAKPVEDTSLVYTLCAPITRAKLAVTQGVYLVFSMLVLFGGILASGSLMLSTMGEYDFLAYLNLVGVTFMLCTAVAMLSYFLSVAFCDTKLGIRLSAGVPIAMMFMSMVGGAGGEQTKWLQKLTPFGWLDSVGIVTGEVETWWMYFAFGGAIIVLLCATVAVFQKKRLPI